MLLHVVFYETEAGKRPAEAFILEQSNKVQLKIMYVLKLIQEINPAPSRFFKKLTGTADLWEVRIEFESNIYRLLGFIHHNNLVILTNGFQKKSQKTDPKHIALATRYKRNYFDKEKHQ